MRKVTLIQFTQHGSEHSIPPDLNRWYRVTEKDDEYWLEDDDGDDYALNAIRVLRGVGTRNTWLIVNDENTQFNIVEIELDDNSPLFI